MDLREVLKEASAEVACQHLDGCKEAGASGLPCAGLNVEAAVGHDTVHMGMPLHLLVPGVQNSGAADPGAEPHRR